VVAWSTTVIIILLSLAWMVASVRGSYG
jgi:hypothetical protein